MIQSGSKNRVFFKTVNSVLAVVLVVMFSFPFSVTPAFAQTVLGLPVPGTFVGMSSQFSLPMMRGLEIYPEQPFQFDFIIDSGDDDLQGDDFRIESEKIIRYFLASMTVPEEEMWVNLSPYEANRIIPKIFGQTEMGRDLLAQDYMLKQLTSSLLYPENELGEEFWNRVYVKAQKQFGTTDIPMDTFNKVWIVPEEATVYLRDNKVFVVDSYLKVMLESDYVALQEASGVNIAMANESKGQAQDLSRQVLQEIIIPEIEREVNQGKTFAPLRQIYHSMILATWYKKNLKESILSQAYANKGKTDGVNVDDETIHQKIYDQYVAAFKKGVFDLIKEEYDPVEQEVIPRKYFSGGVHLKANISEKAMLSVEKVMKVFKNLKLNIVSSRVEDPQGELDRQEIAKEAQAQTDLAMLDVLREEHGEDALKKMSLDTISYRFWSTDESSEATDANRMAENKDVIPEVVVGNARVAHAFPHYLKDRPFPAINYSVKIIGGDVSINEIYGDMFRKVQKLADEQNMKTGLMLVSVIDVDRKMIVLYSVGKKGNDDDRLLKDFFYFKEESEIFEKYFPGYVYYIVEATSPNTVEHALEFYNAELDPYAFKTNAYSKDPQTKKIELVDTEAEGITLEQIHQETQRLSTLEERKGHRFGFELDTLNLVGRVKGELKDSAMLVSANKDRFVSNEATLKIYANSKSFVNKVRGIYSLLTGQNIDSKSIQNLIVGEELRKINHLYELMASDYELQFKNDAVKEFIVDRNYLQAEELANNLKPFWEFLLNVSEALQEKRDALYEKDSIGIKIQPMSIDQRPIQISKREFSNKLVIETVFPMTIRHRSIDGLWSKDRMKYNRISSAKMLSNKGEQGSSYDWYLQKFDFSELEGFGDIFSYQAKTIGQVLRILDATIDRGEEDLHWIDVGVGQNRAQIQFLEDNGGTLTSLAQLTLGNRFGGFVIERALKGLKSLSSLQVDPFQSEGIAYAMKALVKDTLDGIGDFHDRHLNANDFINLRNKTRLTAIDIEDVRWKNKEDVRFLLGDAAKVLEKEKGDFITLFHVWPYVNDPLALFANTFNALSDNGIAVISGLQRGISVTGQGFRNQFLEELNEFDGVQLVTQRTDAILPVPIKSALIQRKKGSLPLKLNARLIGWGKYEKIDKNKPFLVSVDVDLKRDSAMLQETVLVGESNNTYYISDVIFDYVENSVVGEDVKINIEGVDKNLEIGFSNNNQLNGVTRVFTELLWNAIAEERDRAGEVVVSLKEKNNQIELTIFNKDPIDYKALRKEVERRTKDKGGMVYRTLGGVYELAVKPRTLIKYVHDLSDEELVFVRSVSRGKTSQTEGWGLGLPFAKEAMRELGGKLFIESSKEKGTTVKAVFPKHLNKDAAMMDSGKSVVGMYFISDKIQDIVGNIIGRKVDLKEVERLLQINYVSRNMQGGNTDVIHELGLDKIFIDLIGNSLAEPDSVNSKVSVSLKDLNDDQIEMVIHNENPFNWEFLRELLELETRLSGNKVYKRKDGTYDTVRQSEEDIESTTQELDDEELPFVWGLTSKVGVYQWGERGKGLPTARSVLRSVGGDVFISSSKEDGTQVRVLYPKVVDIDRALLGRGHEKLYALSDNLLSIVNLEHEKNRIDVSQVAKGITISTVSEEQRLKFRTVIREVLMNALVEPSSKNAKVKVSLFELNRNEVAFRVENERMIDYKALRKNIKVLTRANGGIVYRSKEGVYALDRDADMKAVVSIENIPDSELVFVYDLGRGKNASESGGSGQGLAYSRSVLRKNGGDIYITSSQEKGTSVTVVYPKASVEHNTIRGEAIVKENTDPAMLTGMKGLTQNSEELSAYARTLHGITDQEKALSKKNNLDSIGRNIPEIVQGNHHVAFAMDNSNEMLKSIKYNIRIIGDMTIEEVFGDLFRKIENIAVSSGIEFSLMVQVAIDIEKGIIVLNNASKENDLEIRFTKELFSIFEKLFPGFLVFVPNAFDYSAAKQLHELFGFQLNLEAKVGSVLTSKESVIKDIESNKIGIKDILNETQVLIDANPDQDIAFGYDIKALNLVGRVVGEVKDSAMSVYDVAEKQIKYSYFISDRIKEKINNFNKISRHKRKYDISKISDGITIEHDFEDDDVDLHLIFEELFYNALAEPGDPNAKITISLRELNDNEIELVMHNEGEMDFEALREKLKVLTENSGGKVYRTVEGVYTWFKSPNSVEVAIEDLKDEELAFVWKLGREKEYPDLGGFGGGLPGRKKYLYHHGGRLSYSSSKGKGTTVTVIYPKQLQYDKAMVGDKKGGIDLNPSHMNLKAEGESIELPVSVSDTFGDQVPVEIKGLIPVIINIRPVTNLPLLLGMKEDDEEVEEDLLVKL